MLKRKIKKLTKALFRKVTGRKLLECCMCADELEVSADTSRVTCSRCVQQLVEPPANLYPKEKSDKPKGWHLKAYFEHNGKVYVRGVEITDAEQLVELKKLYVKPKKSPAKKKTITKKTAKKKLVVKKKKGK
jgi:hypothetical protein